MDKSQREKQAFNNEFKGVLLEYALGRILVRTSGELIHPGDDFIKKIEEYQNYLLCSDLHTYKSISLIADSIKSKIVNKYGSNFKKIELAGKYHRSKWGEGDIKVSFNDREPVLFSIKMIKDSSFINTKSAGAYSFFSRYFNNESAQERFSKSVSFAFNIFKQSFLKKYDIYDSEESFTHILRSIGISDRPGSLSNDERELLLSFYETCLQSMISELKILMNSNEEQFLSAVKKLCGLVLG